MLNYFRWDTKRFGDDYLASDVEILDVGTTNKNGVPFTVIGKKTIVGYADGVTDEQIKELCALAKEIWNEYSICFISQEQIDYMLEKFQSEQVVKAQLNYQQYSYYFLEEDGENFGYFAVQKQKDNLFLSKIYIKKDFRGKGYARKAFTNAIVPIARELELPKITLTVNKYNFASIMAYEKLGFIRTSSVETDIGNGYVMDDYIYEFEL